MLVDAETLLHPQLDSTPADSLLATEILPSTVTTSRGQQVVYGGFDMAVAGSVGRPHLHGSAQPLAEYRSCFDDGVRQMGILLARNDQDIDA
ncbi:MAG: hypothetical protein ABWY93_24320, partial [Mycobacterium sp.]